MIEKSITHTELFELRDDRIPVITQEKSTGRILGLNMTNRAAFEKTTESGVCHYYDDVNDCIYLKGEHSGEVETILEIRWDGCHARRHEAHLLYVVEMAEGRCKFGVKDCHFFVYRDGRFVFDLECVKDVDSVEAHRDRIETFLSTAADAEHKKRFKRK